MCASTETLTFSATCLQVVRAAFHGKSGSNFDFHKRGNSTVAVVWFAGFAAGSPLMNRLHHVVRQDPDRISWIHTLEIVFYCSVAMFSKLQEPDAFLKNSLLIDFMYKIRSHTPEDRLKSNNRVRGAVYSVTTCSPSLVDLWQGPKCRARGF